MKGIKFANKVSAQCLVSGLGHDWISITRDTGGTMESWTECYQCEKIIIELETQEKECKHTMKCVVCGYTMIKKKQK